MPAQAQLWSGILDPTRAIDWSAVGVPGGIPTRTTICATLSSPGAGVDATATIQNALNACATNGVVVLNPGTFRINTFLTIPTTRVLRGSGNTQTILDFRGNSFAAIDFGSGTQPGAAVRTITGGATKGSTSITFTGGSVSTGQLLRIAQNDAGQSYMTAAGDGGFCDFCDNGFPAGSDYDSAQTVLVTTGGASSATFTPPLAFDFTSSPLAWPYSVGCDGAGLESLQLFANNTGYVAMIHMKGVIRSWVKLNETNFADNSHLQMYYGLFNEVRDNYFHDGFKHGPGGTDTEVRLDYSQSSSLIINNIHFRQHVSIMLERGATANVVAYNFSTGNYHTDQNGVLQPLWFINHIDFHGAHPLMNLIEGNVVGKSEEDSYWGSSSHTTYFRNLFTGFNQTVLPNNARGTLQTGSPTTQTDAQQAGTLNWAQTFTNNVGNIVGSTGLLAQSPSQYMLSPTGTVFGTACWHVGFPNDTGKTIPGGFVGLTESTQFKHGLYNCLTGAFTWDTGHPDHTLPSSFFLSAKPAWWGSTLPWPPIGPDITGGTAGGVNGHANKIPAQVCFDNATLDVDNRPIIDLAACFSTTAPTIIKIMQGGIKSTGGVRVQ